MNLRETTWGHVTADNGRCHWQDNTEDQLIWPVRKVAKYIGLVTFRGRELVFTFMDKTRVWVEA